MRSRTWVPFGKKPSLSAEGEVPLRAIAGVYGLRTSDELRMCGTGVRNGISTSVASTLAASAAVPGRSRPPRIAEPQGRSDSGRGRRMPPGLHIRGFGACRLAQSPGPQHPPCAHLSLSRAGSYKPRSWPTEPGSARTRKLSAHGLGSFVSDADDRQDDPSSRAPSAVCHSPPLQVNTPILLTGTDIHTCTSPLMPQST
jgi:hypothetical protein